MGLISGLLNIIFGNDRNVITQTAEVFRENTEGGAERTHQLRLGAMAQFSQEFEQARQGWFDRLMDGVNRVPRPALALGTLGLFLAAMIDPVWFAARMQGIALVPEPLWWLLGVIVSFYFGARHQVKSQQFHKSIARTMSFAPQVVDNISALGALKATSPGVADTAHDAQLSTLSVAPDENTALKEWQAQRLTTATK